MEWRIVKEVSNTFAEWFGRSLEADQQIEIAACAIVAPGE